MKTSKFFFLGLLSLGIAFTSCSSDDEEEVPAGTCAAPSDLLVDNTTADAVTLSWISTGTSWTIEYGESGFSQGSGTQVEADANPFTINGLDASTSYDFYVRNNCSDATSAFSSAASVSTPSPLVGTWEAYDVSPALVAAGFTSITAIFGSTSYDVTAYSDGTGYEFTGTYTVSEPNAEGIYGITLQQSTPSAATSEGILKVYVASADSMWYEVVQTDPALAGITPPTQEGGFGSTSNSSFGNYFVQKYTRQ